MSRRPVTAVIAAMLLVSSCSSSSDGAAVTTAAAVETTTTLAPTGTVTWLPCGAISCGTLKVSATHRDPSGPTINVAVYSRPAVSGTSRGTVVLIPDWDGPTARDLAEQPTVWIGAAAREFDVLALSPRGFADSTPLPCTLDVPYADPSDDMSAAADACKSDTALLPSSYGVIESVGDLEAMTAALQLPAVHVVAWGRGATIAAAWKLVAPRMISSAVLDSPEDPGIAPEEVTRFNLAAEDAAVNTAMLWCTSHLSCPFVENAAKRVQFVAEDIDEGKAGPKITRATFRLAFHHAVATGDYGALFTALHAAETSMDFGPLAAIASEEEGNIGAARTSGVGETDRIAARIAGGCSDMSATDADAVRTVDDEFVPTLFRIGHGSTLARICLNMPESADPLGFVRAADGARGAKVQLFVAAGDGVTSPAMVKAFGKRADWKVKTVRMNRHLVVGHDRTTTKWVSDFLLAG